MTSPQFAFDKQSARSRDADGRMRVRNCILSTAEVNPYRGAEIVRWQELGLDPDKVYHLYRDPDELKRAADSFNGVPLMVKHIVQTADNPQKEYQAGSVHNVRFEAPYLRGDLLVSDGYAIGLIEADELADLSCGYRYDPVMQSGEAGGSKYDGVMRNIGGNHVALVDDGRATNAHVADHALRHPASPGQPKGAFDMAFENERETGAPPEAAQAEQNEQSNMAGLGAALKQIAVLLESQGKMLANIHAKQGGGEDTAAVDEAEGEEMEREHEREGEQARDHSEEDGEGEQARDMELEPVARVSGGLVKGEAEDGDEDAEADLPESEQEGTPARGGKTPLAAMDAKIQRAVAQERRRAAAVRQAEQDVAPYVGQVHGMDSAADIYRLALEQAGIDMRQVAKGTEKVAFNAMRAAQAAARGGNVGMSHSGAHALDSKAKDAARDALLANLQRIRVR